MSLRASLFPAALSRSTDPRPSPRARRGPPRQPPFLTLSSSPSAEAVVTAAANAVVLVAPELYAP